MKMWKKLICLVALVGGIVILIWMTKVKRESLIKIQTEPNIIKLEIWYPWSDQNEHYKNAFLKSISEYNEKHLTIQLEPYGMDMELYREKLPADIASNDIPDIYYCFTGNYLKKIVQSGRILALDEYLINDDIKNNTQIQGMKYDGNLYGLGFAETNSVFLVNERLFEKYGIEIPETTEELMEVCEEFLNHGITPLACSENMDIGFRMYLEALCLGITGIDECMEILEGTREADEKFLDGVKCFLRLVDMGAFAPDEEKKELYDAEEEFCMSRIPMYYTKNSFLGGILQKNHPLYGKIHAISFPGVDKNVIMGGVTDCFVVNAATEYPMESIMALEEITLSFAAKLHESGSGISIWEDMNNIPEKIQKDYEGNMVYLEMQELREQAENRMPFWEIAVKRESMQEYLKISKDLYDGKMNAEDFTEKLQKNFYKDG